MIRFIEPSLRVSHHQAPIKNQSQHLRIVCDDAVNGQALTSGIALPKGAKLEFTCQGGRRVAMTDILSSISTTHLSNLSSPTFMQYRVYLRVIELRGPNGTTSFVSYSGPDVPSIEFPQLPLANIRRFHLDSYCNWKSIRCP